MKEKLGRDDGEVDEVDDDDMKGGHTDRSRQMMEN
jgi:hypothetical protein